MLQVSLIGLHQGDCRSDRAGEGGRLPRRRQADTSRERLVRLAKKHGVALRQSYRRKDKLALMMQQRYAHPKPFNRAKRALKTLKTYLGRAIRDIARKIAGGEALRQIFAHPLMLAGRVPTQTKIFPSQTYRRLSLNLHRRL